MKKIKLFLVSGLSSFCESFFGLKQNISSWPVKIRKRTRQAIIFFCSLFISLSSLLVLMPATTHAMQIDIDGVVKIDIVISWVDRGKISARIDKVTIVDEGKLSDEVKLDLGDQGNLNKSQKEDRILNNIKCNWGG